MKEQTILPIGPCHPILAEPEYFKVVVKGDRVVDVDVNLGYNHKGIENIFESKTWPQLLPTVARICGICNTAHTTCTASAFEKLNRIKVPERAAYIRTLTCELERLHSHMLWLGIYADAIGFETLFMHIWKVREKVMEAFEEAYGQRVTRAINTFGGVRWDLPPKIVKLILKNTAEVENYAPKLLDTFSGNPLIKKRLKGKGILSRESARKLCAVGPTTRASGVRYDVRKSLPYCAYKEVGFRVVTRKEGDCWARALARVEELIESCRIIKQCLKSLPKGPINLGKIWSSKEGAITFRVEAPRGEDLHYLIAGEGAPYRLRVRPPTFANVSTLKEMLIGANIADVPLIILSIDPCFSCTDRIAVYNQGGERV